MVVRNALTLRVQSMAGLVGKRRMQALGTSGDILLAQCRVFIGLKRR
ncbi:hypothetical protein KCP71_09880 [Salmonella enterica subsp. enterica]|nr:hypothetical protein KCP71_09880 [Salmonella enterica subsp. enterica]